MAQSIGPFVQGAGTAYQTDQSGQSWEGSTWWQQLQPGSWRGVGFVMDAAQTIAGRRIALHEYPYRDDIWIEDLGRLPRRFAFQAFLIGDDCYQQRNSMIQACEQPGAGTLVHPTLGSVQCVLVDFNTTDRRERGRMVEISFQFVVSGDLTFPTVAAATGEQVNSQADALYAASSSDLQHSVAAVSSVPNAAIASVATFAGMATSVVYDATRAINAVSGLQGYYGRYSSGRRSTLLSPTDTVQTALSRSVTTAAAVISAADNLGYAAGRLL
jgi:prophage DNA circulation protein